jgi:four helix bundle protein
VSKQVRERAFDLAVRIVKLVRALPKETAAAVIARQVVRSGTSVGANIEEAQVAHSRRDFVRRMNIARAEARETLYWLRILAASEIMSARRLQALIGEAEEVVRMLMAIVKTARKPREDVTRNS